MKNKLSLCKQFLASNFWNSFASCCRRLRHSAWWKFLSTAARTANAPGQTSWHSGQISCFTTVFSFCSVRSPARPPFYDCISQFCLFDFRHLQPLFHPNPKRTDCSLGFVCRRHGCRSTQRFPVDGSARNHHLFHRLPDLVGAHHRQVPALSGARSCAPAPEASVCPPSC